MPLCAVTSSTLSELANDTRTRFFAALDMVAGNSGYAAIQRLVDTVDSVFAVYGLPPYYAERRLHFSVAWSIRELPVPLPRLSIHPTGSTVTFDRVDCRIGERVSTFQLSAGRSVGSSASAPRLHRGSS